MRKTRGLVAALTLAILEIQPAASESAAERDATFKDDYSQLREIAAALSVTKDAVGWRVDRVNGSLDIKIGSMSSEKAEVTAHFACRWTLKHQLHRTWHVRVYSVDGHIAAECPIWGGS